MSILYTPKQWMIDAFGRPKDLFSEFFMARLNNNKWVHINSMPKYLRLKEKHPTAKKFFKLCQEADELGISLEICADRMSLTDRDQPNVIFFVDDIEDDRGDRSFSSFPPPTECKIIHEDLIHAAAEQKAMDDERKRLDNERAVKEKLEAERRAAAEIKRRAEAEIANEKRERELLAQLKAKYE